MKPTDQNLSYLRQRPHKTRLWLSIYEPNIVFQTQVSSGTYQFGETRIDFGGNVSGTWQNTYPNMTVLIGSEMGGDDVGRIRLRYCSGTYAVFSENNIIWGKNEYYLTFLDYIDIQAIFPKIIKDPNNNENVVFYKDDDIPYSNQNSIYGSFPCAGVHQARFIETGTVDIYWSATGTYNVRGDTMTYSWIFEGGTPTGSTLLTPGNVQYNTPGHYKTILTVSSSSGAIDKTYRYVSIYERPEKGTNVPILKWTLNSISGSRGEGGYTGNIRVWQNLSSIQPNALVVIFADNEYGDTKISIGGNSQRSENIFFVGYILRDSIEFNYKDGWAEFDIGSPTEVMKEAEGFSVSCESKASPSTWFELQEMTVPKAIYHYLRWHSTVLNVMDFQYTGDNRLVQYFDTDRASLYDAINTFLQEGIYGELCSDRQGKLWAEISPIGYEDPIDDIKSGITILKQDWMGNPNISRRRSADVSFVEMGGIEYSGVSTNAFKALLSNAPSITPLYRGKTDSPRQGLILNNQTQLNKIAGNYLASKNSDIEDVSILAAGNYGIFDIAPQEKLYLMIDGSETDQNIPLYKYPFRLQSINWNYVPEKEYLYPEITLEQIATGTAGQTVIIPPTPDVNGYNFPALELPPFPSFPVAPVEQQGITTMLGIEAENDTFFYTLNFDTSHPTWVPWRYGIDPSDNISMNRTAFIAPNGAVWTTAFNGSGKKNIYRAPYIGGKFEKIIDSAWMDSLYGPDNVYVIKNIVGLGCAVDKDEEVAFIVSHAWFNDLKTIFIGNSSGWTEGSTWGFSSDRFGRLTGAQDEWVWDAVIGADTGFYLFDSGGTVLNYEFFGQGDENVFHSRAGATKTIVKWKNPITGAGGLLRSEDNTRKTTIIPVTNATYRGLDVDSTGMFLMSNWNVPAYKGRSADGGYSWFALDAMPPAGENTHFSYCGGTGFNSRWVGGNGAIYYSENFGNTWSDKTGNLLQIFLPPSGANVVKFLPHIRKSEI